MNPDEAKSMITKVLLMLFTSLSTSLHLSESASTWATASSDIADVLVLGYGVYSHWDMKKVPETARVVGGMLLLALLCGLGSPVQAANLAGPMKALPANYDPTTTGGWYVGLGTFLETQKATFGDTTVLSQSGALGAVGGYGRGNGKNWWQLQGEAYWTNLDGNGVCAGGASCGTAAKFTGGVWLKVGLPPGILQALPQIGNLFPGLSTTTLADNVFPYFAGGIAPSDVSASLGLANARAWVFPAGARLGMITKLTNGTVSDLGAEVDFAGSGIAIGGAKVNPSTAYKAYAHFLFGA